MKKSFLTLMLALMASVVVNAATTFEIGDFRYSDTGADRYYVLGLTDAAKSKKLTQITIPGFVTYQGKTLPTYVNSMAFYENTTLQNVTMRYGLIGIGYDAFARCSALKEVFIPSSCGSLGDYIFSDAGNSKEDMTIWYSRLDVPSTLSSTAFYNIKSKNVSLILPTEPAANKFRKDNYVTAHINTKNISALGQISCDVVIGNNCYVVTKAPVTSGNTIYASGELTLVGAYPGSISLTKESECFTRDLDDGWYYECTSVADSAFYSYQIYTGNITITYPTIKRIGRGAFANVKNVTNVTVKCDTIYYDAFSGSSITSLTMQEGTRFLYNGAIYNCANLSTVSIPASLQTFGDNDNWIFNKSMSKYTVASGNMLYSSDTHGALYDKGKTQLIHFPPAATFGSLPSTLTTIGVAAFYYYKGKSIIVPHGTTEIKDLAFDYATSLEYVKIPSTVRTISRNEIFKGATALKELVITTLNPTLLPTFSEMFGTTKVPSSLKIRVPQRTLTTCKEYWNDQSGKITGGAFDIYVGNAGANRYFYILNKTRKEAYLTNTNVDYVSFNSTTSTGSINVPKTYTYNNITYTTTAIDEAAFYGATGLNELVLPESITTVGANFVGNNSSDFHCYVPNSDLARYLTSLTQPATQVTVCPYLRDYDRDNLTFSPLVNVQLPTDSEIRFYTIKEGDYSSKMMKATMFYPGSNIAAGEGTVVTGIVPGKLYRLPRATASVSKTSGSLLVGVTAATTVSATSGTSKRNYTYVGKQFQAITGSAVIPTGEAYLSAPYQPTAGITTLNVDIFPLTGDVNGDGKVDTSDVTTLVNMILGSVTMNLTRADIDGNGIINVSDVTALVNLILK